MNAESKNTAAVSDTVSGNADKSDRYGAAVLYAETENNIPTVPDEEAFAVSEELIEKNNEVYKELAK